MASLLAASCFETALPGFCQAAPEQFIPRLTQYVHTAWKVRDGDLSAEPTAIAQTKDGYLWIGTQAGLLQFDGIRFRPSTRASEEGFNDFEVTALYGGNDGSLWVGGRNHLGHLTGDRYESYGWKGYITQFASDPTGRIWFSRTRNADSQGALCSIDGSNVHCIGKHEGLDCRYGNALLSDGGGGFWVGWDKLCHWNGHSSSVLPFGRSKDDLATMVAGFARRPDGAVVVGIDAAPRGRHATETVAISGQDVRVLSDIDTLDQGIDVIALLTAKDGSLWVGTRQNGIYHVTTSRTDHYGSNDGLSGDHINSMIQDVEGNIWIATTDGIDRLRVPKIVTFSRKEGLDVDQVGSVSAGSKGSVWISTLSGLNRYTDGNLESIPVRAAGGGKMVLTTFEDSSGKLWISTSSHLLLYSNGKYETIKQPDGSPVLHPYGVVQDSQGSIWIQPTFNSSGASLFRMTRGIAVPVQLGVAQRIMESHADPNNGLWLRFLGSSDLYLYRDGLLSKAIEAPRSSEFMFFLAEPDGGVWALPLHGLLHWSQGRWKLLDENGGLPCSSMLQMQFDIKGDLWLLSRCGLQRIAGAEIRLWAAGKIEVVHPQWYGPSDGARIMSTYFIPHSTLASDGTLWFGGEAGVQVFNPENLKSNETPPPVHIERLMADGADYAPGARLRPLTHNVEIDYTALSLVDPRRIQFRYRLIGSDKRWQDATSRRQAFYQDLRPGKYRFEVLASNNDGVWNLTGDALTFTVPPAFYQTSWFNGMIVILLVISVWLMTKFRALRAASFIEEKMRERLMERDRIARELHDTLLQGFQSIVFRFQTAWNTMPPEQRYSVVISDTLARADAVLREGRAKIHDLRGGEPGQELWNELKDFIAWHFPPDAPQCSVKWAGRMRPLNEIVREEVVAVAKEALLNALNHSHGTHIICDLHFEKHSFTLTCADDGVGIPADVVVRGRANHYGLLGMRERSQRVGGTLKITPKSPHGTIVQMHIPGALAYTRDRIASGPFARLKQFLFQTQSKSD